MSSPYSGSSYASDGDWLSSFLEQGGFAQLLLEVPMAYFQESLFLYDLDTEIQYFQEAIDLITDNALPDGIPADEVAKSASILYAKAHCRYALTPQGLEDLRAKYETCYFGKCPRFLCEGQRLLPYGASEKPGRSVLRCLCPRCGELYKLFGYNSEFYIDGCFYGPNVAYAFQLAYNCCDGGRLQLYVPLVYGFRLHSDGERARASGGPRGTLSSVRSVRAALSRAAGKDTGKEADDPIASRALEMLGKGEEDTEEDQHPAE